MKKLNKTLQQIKLVLKFCKNKINALLCPIRKNIEEFQENKVKKTWLSKDKILEYRKKIKIYDIFTYNGEADILEIRLNILLIGNWIGMGEGFEGRVVVVTAYSS